VDRVTKPLENVNVKMDGLEARAAIAQDMSAPLAITYPRQPKLLLPPLQNPKFCVPSARTKKMNAVVRLAETVTE